ncbi:MaoC/PaaZ C-terminal domain-containing protein [Litorihabitans aurantiacus]|uniref:Acyl dehydratase n=1 Tax=Litorihabitans aurantiacus TaxID=1930061 RepID=A0AA38CU29_9MICO|nr:MaoC/PaaZ C-terminal domain-containing protein [Litorihabitans aurantiacus]GMA32322.1 acyl dehydratase [Litorihabitans aurantiacus]
MSAPGALTAAAVGDVLFTREVEVTRDRLVRYAGASRDFNPIHYNDAVAEQVGLPGVIAHGMLTMGLAGSALTDWLAENDGAAAAGRVARYGTRFSRPIPVPATGGVTLTVTGTLGAVDQTADDGAPCVRVDLRAEAGGVTVLAKAQVLVRL